MWKSGLFHSRAPAPDHMPVQSCTPKVFPRNHARWKGFVIANASAVIVDAGRSSRAGGGWSVVDRRGQDLLAGGAGRAEVLVHGVRAPHEVDPLQAWRRDDG